MSKDVSITNLHKRITTTIGEGPVWLEDSGELIFVDYFKSTVLKVNGSTNELTQVTLPGRPCVSLACPTTVKDRFVALSWQDVITFDWNHPEGWKVLASFEHGLKTHANDAKADKNGRMWFATMGVLPDDPYAPIEVAKGAGSVYSSDVDKTCGYSVTKAANAKPVDLANGFEWSLDNRTMFFVDSLERVVFAFDYDATTGALSNQRVAIDFVKLSTPELDLGLPDGLTVDSEDKLWVAGYNGHHVCRFDPLTGQLIGRIVFDTKTITSCAFGGPHMNQLYVTSSPRACEDGGSLYRVDGLNVRGFHANRANFPPKF